MIGQINSMSDNIIPKKMQSQSVSALPTSHSHNCCCVSRVCWESQVPNPYFGHCNALIINCGHQRLAQTETLDELRQEKCRANPQSLISTHSSFLLLIDNYVIDLIMCVCELANSHSTVFLNRISWSMLFFLNCQNDRQIKEIC